MEHWAVCQLHHLLTTNPSTWNTGQSVSSITCTSPSSPVLATSNSCSPLFQTQTWSSLCPIRLVAWSFWLLLTDLPSLSASCSMTALASTESTFISPSHLLLLL